MTAKVSGGLPPQSRSASVALPADLEAMLRGAQARQQPPASQPAQKDHGPDQRGFIIGGLPILVDLPL